MCGTFPFADDETSVVAESWEENLAPDRPPRGEFAPTMHVRVSTQSSLPGGGDQFDRFVARDRVAFTVSMAAGD